MDAKSQLTVSWTDAPWKSPMYTDDGKYIVQLIPKGGAAAAAGGAGGCGTTSCSGAASDAGSGTEEYLAAMTAAGASGGVAGAAGAQMSRGVGGAAGAGGVRSRSAGASVSGRSKLPMALGALGVVGLCAGPLKPSRHLRSPPLVRLTRASPPRR